ncbi:MAG: nucleoside kinase, partial [Anaerolineae bacterium]
MTKMTEEFKFTKVRHTVQVLLPDGRAIEGPRGATIEAFLQPLAAEGGAETVGAIINGSLRELTFCIGIESQVVPVTMHSSDGMRIYRRSLNFLLETAFEELFSGGHLIIDHSVSFGGYFCRVTGREALTQADLDRLAGRMRELVEQDLRISRSEVPLADAIEIFRQAGQQDKVRLLAHRKKDYLILYELNGHRDYHHGYMVPSSGYLKWFELTFIEGGFTLRFPRRHNSTEIEPLGEYPKLLATFREYGDWLERLGIESVGALNDAILDGRIRELVLVSEALHEQRIAEMAGQIAARKDKVRVVLIAGPSSSGKTTTSKRLSVQLLAHGLHPFPLEMDNFFVSRDMTPKDEKGEYDFEHLDAIDRPRLNHDVKKLIAGEEVQIPRYDFHTG